MTEIIVLSYPDRPDVDLWLYGIGCGHFVANGFVSDRFGFNQGWDYYTNYIREKHRAIAESTLETFASIAGHFGIFGATYGIAVALYSRPHTQVAVVGNDRHADELYRAALSPYSISKSVLRLDPDHVVAQNLPPTLAQTIPNLLGIKQKKTIAVLCSGFTCQPPVDTPEAMRQQLGQQEHVTALR